MTPELEEALIELASALDACGLPFVLIGGLAVALSGEPRSTLDVDVSVWTEPESLGIAVECLSSRLKALHPNARAFAEARRVLPVATSNGIRADVVFATLPIEREMIRRGIAKHVGERTIPVASVEDLVLMKLLSTREKDLADARALLRRFGKSLDRAYLLPKLKEAAEGLDRPEILRIVEQAI